MIKKLPIILLILLSGSMAVLASEEINLRTIRYDELVVPGQSVPIYISVKNMGFEEIDDLNVQIDSPTIELFSRSAEIELYSHDVASFIVPIFIPYYLSHGDYPIRITISDNDEIRRLYYRSIIVR